MRGPLAKLVPAVIVVALVAAGLLYWWGRERPAAPTPPPAPPRVEAPPSPAPSPEPAIRYPIAPPAEAQTLPALAESDPLVIEALAALIGNEAVSAFVNPVDFVRHVVATVDNLPRERATPRLWPVKPTPGRIALEGAGDGLRLAPKNYARYAPFVRLVESVDTAVAVALYVRLYPLFQRAYEELGYPGRYFNDRLVEVIDHLLAAPDGQQPVRLVAPEVKGPLALPNPWAYHRFADPALEARSAGHKIMIRVGPDNAARLKAKLREARALVTAGAVPR